jgi:acetoin utilization deacetylase AcuC-like enzyme
LWLHTAEYVDSIEVRSNDQGGEAGDAAAFSTGAYEIARLAAGGAIEAVDAVIDGRVARAYALVRPPGHHAVADRGLGFCIFGNTALAAMHARRRGLDRVAIVDWDVHHGNGTESAFYADPHVLTISLHQEHIYPPDSGAIRDTGTGEGTGYNLNIPLPAGSGRAVYEYAFEQIVLSALNQFRPDLIMVACGFDAAWIDPTARMNLTPKCYARLAQSLLERAAELCGGRIVFVHEGGYSAEAVPYCGLAVLEALTGHSTGVPVNVLLDGAPETIGLHEHERANVDRAALNLKFLR